MTHESDPTFCVSPTPTIPTTNQTDPCSPTPDDPQRLHSAATKSEQKTPCARAVIKGGNPLPSADRHVHFRLMDCPLSAGRRTISPTRPLSVSADIKLDHDDVNLRQATPPYCHVTRRGALRKRGAADGWGRRHARNAGNLKEEL